MGIPSGYTSAQVVQAVPTGINSALVKINTTTVSAQNTVTLSNVFSSTYHSYMFTISNLSGSDAGIRATLGTTATSIICPSICGVAACQLEFLIFGRS